MPGHGPGCRAVPQAEAIAADEARRAGIGAGGRLNRRDSAWSGALLDGRNLLRCTSGGVMRPPGAMSEAKLTHMSLKADAYVMTRVTAPPDTDAYVIFSPWVTSSLRARHRARMLRYGTHGGSIGR
jgi:hypothetical protein